MPGYYSWNSKLCQLFAPVFTTVQYSCYAFSYFSSLDCERGLFLLLDACNGDQDIVLVPSLINFQLLLLIP